MGNDQPTKVTVQAVIQAPVEQVWRYWTETEHITGWNQASDEWHAPKAENDLRVGGKFVTRKAPIPLSSSRRAGRRFWTISSDMRKKINPEPKGARSGALLHGFASSL